PEAWRDHQGLAYERFRWRLDRGRRAEALELLFGYDESEDSLGNPGAWARHRERLARGLMQDGQPEAAYRVASRHHLDDGADGVAALEWLAGYVALRFLDDPGGAADHFRRFDLNVASPISQGRAGYWLGRALEAAGDAEGAQAAYRSGGAWQTSFYGQLAAERAGLPADPLLTGTETFPPLADTSLSENTVLRAARALQALGERNLAERFMAHLAETLPRAEIGTLIDVALSLDEPHIALIIAKRAAQAGHELHRGYFPLTDLAELRSPVAPELSLAIARRESEFDPVVVSGAGARGLMQLMPGTAQDMARLIGVDYARGRLTSDPLYNARLGTAYLGELEEEFGKSVILVPAAYNAGPSRARRWSAEFGDPSDPGVDPVDWIEDVPFSETRNYIMRVSESLLPYRARLTGEAGEVALSRWLRKGYGDLRAGSGNGG
ncbi:MAG: lytic transglycosylase domain-containing protein, partial [Jannaschia sp.]